MGKEFWCLAVFHCPKFLRKFLKIMETSKILGTYSQIIKTISIDLTIKECIVRVEFLLASSLVPAPSSLAFFHDASLVAR